MTRVPRPLSPRRVLRTRAQPRRCQHAVDLAARPAFELTSVAPSEDTLRELVAENLTLVRELARIQQRASQWRDDYAARLDQLDAHLMQARAQAIAKDTLLAAQREALDALRKRAAVWLTNEELLRRLSDSRARIRSLESELAGTRSASKPIEAAAAVSRDVTADVAARAPAARNVLCVGGRTRQLPQYRALVERNGGRFAHAGGSVDDDPDALGELLDAADLVILQAGYVCLHACRIVEAHCARTGKNCICLDKPCAQAFALGLAQAQLAACR